MPVKEIEKEIAGIKFKLRGLTWDGHLTLIDEGFTQKKYSSLCILEPQNFDFNLLDKKEGLELLKEINIINKESNPDFPKSDQEQLNSKKTE